MDISETVGEGLKLINSLPLTYVNQVISSVVSLLLAEPKFERASQILPEKRSIIEEVYSSLLSFIVYSVQHNINETTIIEYLSKTLKLSSDKVSIITSSIQLKKQLIANALSNVQSFPPKLIDSTWRLDHIITSATGEPIYFIVLTTEENGSIKHIKFTCDLFQLQDFASKLKEIVAQIEKFAGQTKK